MKHLRLGLRTLAIGCVSVVLACSSDDAPPAGNWLQEGASIEQTADRAVHGVCLDSAPETDPADGAARCVVEEERPAGAPCGAGHVEGPSGCLICQQGDGTDRTRDHAGHDVSGCAASQATGDFWVYQGESADCPAGGEVRFQGDSRPLALSTARVTCQATTAHAEPEPPPVGDGSGDAGP